ncbi:MAG: RNA methyltransferase [Polyangiaceae bacterium]|nr:RNA methyltransferase [Polyangiaceae bacterium]
MRLERVASRDDPRLDAFRDVRDRDRRQAGEFLVEGEVPFRVQVARGRHPTRAVLLAEGREEKLGDALARLPDETPVWVLPQREMDAVVGFAIHRGVLAACSRREPESVDELVSSLPDDAVVVAALSVVNHDNVGGVFRNAAALGARAVLLDGVTCDPLYRKAIRVSAGAALFVPFAREADPRALFAILARGGYHVAALSPRADARPVSSLPRVGRLALVVGAEGPGLDGAVMRAASSVVRVPMVAGFDSLNVATALAIALYERATAR